MESKLLIPACWLQLVILGFKGTTVNSINTKRVTDGTKHSCHSADQIYNSTHRQFKISSKETQNIAFQNASSLYSITIVVLPLECSPSLWLQDCNSGLIYNLTTSRRKALFRLNVTKTAMHLGNTYILSFARNDSCSNTTFIVLERKDSVTTASTTAELGRSTTQKSSTKTNNYLTNLEPSTTETIPFTNYTRTLLNVSGGVISNKIDLQTTGNLNFYTTGSSPGSVSSNNQILFSSQEPNLITTNMEFSSSTSALRSTLPLNFSNFTTKILKVISIIPSKVHYTIADSLTTFKANASEFPDSKDLSTAPTVEVKLKNTNKDNPNSTMALGITISLFAVAVIIIALMIIRVLYKSRKNVDLTSDAISTVFCSDDFMHSTGFINDVPSSVATQDFIKIRKVSDSTTDEMMEVEDQRFNKKTYGESTFGSSSTPRHSPNRVNQDSKYAGLSGFKKYPASQPSKASSYVSNRNSRYNSQQSDTDYFQYKRH